ncbi:MAG: hypothetical protein OXR03_21345 [Rhodospirillaceae bacterium]|nr:hypothetical protein [Rhodospirillaceae bacterium]
MTDNHRHDDIAPKADYIPVDMNREWHVWDNVLNPELREVIRISTFDESVSEGDATLVLLTTPVEKIAAILDGLNSASQAEFERNLAAGPIFDVGRMRESLRRGGPR